MKKFSFDYDQLRQHVLDRRWRERLSWAWIANETGVSSPVLRYHIIGTNRPPGIKNERMSADVVIRLMMWLGDHDIRDYLIEGEDDGEGS